MTKKIINDRQRARKVYGFVRRLPDTVSLQVSSAESNASVISLDWKESVRVASAVGLVFPPGAPPWTIDGVTLNDGDRILLKDQAPSSLNGIYVVDTVGGTWDRADDAIPGDTMTCGAVVYVEEGTVNEGTKWILTTKNVTLGGSQDWVLFDRGNDWITSTPNGEMKTSDPVAIGGDYPSTIAPDVFFYVSGSRMVGQPSLENTNISLFDGDVTISGSLNMVGSDGFYGDMLEISGSAKITTGSLYLQRAGTNDYVYFVESSTGNSYQNGNAFLTGSLAQGYGSEANGLASTAEGLFSNAFRFGQYAQASSGFASNYLGNSPSSLGKSQYSRIVWCGVAASGNSTLYFKGYDSLGDLTPYVLLENNKSYYVRASAVVADDGDQTDTAMFVTEAVFYKTGDLSTRVGINYTLAMGSIGTSNSVLRIVPDGDLGISDLSVVLVATTPPFGTVGSVKGTVEIELVELDIT